MPLVIMSDFLFKTYFGFILSQLYSDFEHLTQPLGQNNPVAGFVIILHSAGLYITQIFFFIKFSSCKEWFENICYLSSD